MATSTGPIKRGGDAQLTAYSSRRQRTSNFRHEDYTVGWICALPIEMTAAEAMLDQIHSPLSQRKDDSNAYTFGNIDAHNVVIACLPKGQYGTNNAATVASNMRRSFPSISTKLMVGIGGGVPGVADIRLGDIVVGTEVVQYDMGKTMPDGKFLPTGHPIAPPHELLTVVSKLEANHGRTSSRVPDILSNMLKSNPSMLEYAHPGVADRLFRSTYNHESSANGCVDCNEDEVLNRIARASDGPRIYYGKIASGNQVMKDGSTRDTLARELGIICFEMEAAGLMSNFPCLVIRGICDYSDSHKNKEWQNHAAAAAAAYAKEFLSMMPITEVTVTRTDPFTSKPRFAKCMSDLFVTDPLEDKEALKRKKGCPAPDTCEWMLETDELVDWLSLEKSVLSNGQSTSILWLYGNPGTGKSTMAIFLAEKLSKILSEEGKSLAYFFCDSNFEHRTKATCVIRGLLWQLVQQYPSLIDYVLQKYDERGSDMFQSFDTLWSIFTNMVEDESTGQKLCIIDALDECEKESQELLLQQLQETLQHQYGGSGLRILITSRPYPEIDEHLRQFARSVNLASFPESRVDIDRCIDQQIMELTKAKRYTKTVQDQIKNILRDKAEGTFLWIGLACKELQSIPSRRAVSFLRGLPRGLHDIFKKLLHSAMQAEDADEATIKLILSVVAVSMRPLTLPELANICQLYESEDSETRTQFTREEVTACRLMVVVQNERVLLLHKSVKDFLTKEFLDEKDADARVAFLCIDQLIGAYHSKSTRREEFEYATEFWGYHAGQSGPKFQILNSQTVFFDDESPTREAWLHYLRRSPQGFPEKFSVLHVAARWGIPTIIDYISSQNSSLFKSLLNNKNYIIRGIGQRLVTRTPLEEAIDAGHLLLVSRLLNENPIITPQTFQIAAYNEKSGLEIIKLLLNHRKESGMVIDIVLEAVLRKQTNGVEVVRFLLDEFNNETWITEKVFRTVLTFALGNDLAKMIFDQYHDGIIITNEFLKDAMSNDAGTDVLKRLLDEHGDVHITEGILEAAASCNNDGPMGILLEKYGDVIVITEKIVREAAKNMSADVMKLLLRCRNNVIHITQKLMDITSFDPSAEVMKILLENHSDEINITEELVERAAGIINADSMKHLLKKYGYVIATPERIIKKGARNYDINVIRFLLEKYGEGISIGDDIIKLIVENGNVEVIKIILGRYVSKTTRIKDIITAAAANRHMGVMELVLEKYGHEIDFTQDDILLIIKEGRPSVVMHVLEKYGNVDTNLQDTIIYAAGNQRHGTHIISLILKRYGDDVAITEEVIIASLRNFLQAPSIISLLLQQDTIDIKITEGIIKEVIRNDFKARDILLLLFEKYGNEIVITEGIIKEAIRNTLKARDILLLLFEKYGNEIVITEGIMKEAVRNNFKTRDILLLLFEKYGSDIVLTENIMKTAVSTWSSHNTLRLLLGKCRDKSIITEAVLKEAMGNEYEGVVNMELLFKLCGGGLDITESVVRAACVHGQLGILTLFRSMAILIPEDQEKIAIFYDTVARGDAAAVEKMLQEGQNPDIKNTKGQTPLVVAILEGHRAIVELLVQSDKVDLNSRDERGGSPIIMACSVDDIDICKILLQTNKVDINSQDSEGRSPLIGAAFWGCESTVASLLEAGADPNLADQDGNTALSFAQSRQYDRIVRLLNEHVEMSRDLEEELCE